MEKRACELEGLRRDWQPALEEVLRLAAYLHPVIRHSLAEEAKRWWRTLEIAEPCPAIQDRPRALYETRTSTAPARP